MKGKKVTCFTDKEEGMMKLVEAMPFLLETKLKEHGAVFEMQTRGSLVSVLTKKW